MGWDSISNVDKITPRQMNLLDDLHDKLGIRFIQANYNGVSRKMADMEIMKLKRMIEDMEYEDN